MPCRTRSTGPRTWPTRTGTCSSPCRCRTASSFTWLRAPNRPPRRHTRRGILGMVSEPDLFVVCKNCSSEVSPYVTECPYCGQRVRKRAPKIERGAPTEEPRTRRRRGARPKPPTLSRLRRDEIPGIAPETRPYVTGVLIVAALLATLVTSTGQLGNYDLGGIYIPLDSGDWWRIATTPFLYSNGGYEFVALVSIGIFGTLVERRFGAFAVLAIFMLAGAGGAALAVTLDDFPVLGGNGAALGLLTAWFVDDRLSARRGTDRENDLIGVYVIFALLLLIPAADTSASFYAGLGGAAGGAVAGAVISPFRPCRRSGRPRLRRSARSARPAPPSPASRRSGGRPRSWRRRGASGAPPARRRPSPPTA